VAVANMRFFCGENTCDDEDDLDTAGITANAPVMMIFLDIAESSDNQLLK